MKIATIGGAGHIGLPLSLILAKKYQVTIVDPSKNVNSIKNRVSPFIDPGIEKYINSPKVIKNLNFEKNLRNVETKFDCVIITLGTPIDEWGNPKIETLTEICLSSFNILKKNGILILRSTVSPGFTEKIYKKSTKLKLKILFCPERIAQAKSFTELFEIPQIVGINKKNNKIKNQIKKIFYFSPSVIFTDYISAELSKLYANFWRYSTFAISNQMYLISKYYGVSTNNILSLIKKNYKRAENIPSPGFAAGPCLYKDTIQIGSSFIGDFSVGNSAVKINENLVQTIAEDALKKSKKKKIIILGAAFKADCDDFRDSLSFKLHKILNRISNNQVIMYDPLVNHPKVFKKYHFKSYKNFFFILCAKHKIFKKILSKIPSANLINVWND